MSKCSCVNHHTSSDGKADTTKGSDRTEPAASLTSGCKDAVETLNQSSPPSHSQRSLSSLHSHCQRLEQKNHTLLKEIQDQEDQSMKSATLQLEQYDRAGSNVHAVQLWVDSQIRDAQQELEEIRRKRQERVNGLRLQLQTCEENLLGARKNLQRLREYGDREHLSKVLEAAELERQLRLSSENHENEAADVELLAKTEIHNLEENYQNIKTGFLEKVVEKHVESLPVSVRRMCVQNQEMKQDIIAYQQLTAHLQGDILKLLETGETLRKSWKEDCDRMCRDLLLNRPRCLPDEEVVLDIPLDPQTPI